MSFGDQTASFFDELSRIQSEQTQQKEEDMGQAWKDGKGMYTGMLLETDTPTDYRPAAVSEPNNPQIILRGS